MQPIKKESEEEALKEAQKISENTNSIIYVIETNINENDEIQKIFYIDDNGLIRVWETLIATFENGTKI